MMSRCRGFTLLEMMMVLVLLGVVARFAVSIAPSPEQENPLDRLRLGAIWASEQAQIEGRIYRLQVHPQGWQIAALMADEPQMLAQEPPRKEARASGEITAGELRLLIQNQPQPLPANLWFLPDGDMTSAELVFVAESGETRRQPVNPTTLFLPKP